MWSWFNFWLFKSGTYQENYPLPWIFQFGRVWLLKVCLSDCLNFLGIRCYLPFLFLILLIFIFSLYLLVIWIRVCRSYWFSQRTNSVSLILCILFYSTLLISALSLFLEFITLLLGVSSFYLRAFKCAMKLLIWGNSSFLM